MRHKLCTQIRIIVASRRAVVVKAEGEEYYRLSYFSIVQQSFVLDLYGILMFAIFAVSSMDLSKWCLEERENICRVRESKSARQCNERMQMQDEKESRLGWMSGMKDDFTATKGFWARSNAERRTIERQWADVEPTHRSYSRRAEIMDEPLLQFSFGCPTSSYPTL